MIDWSKGYTQETPSNCGDFTFTGMENDKAYNLYVKGTDSAVCTFHHAKLVFNLPPNHGPTTQGTKTLYSFLRVGNDVLVSWTSGY